MSDGDQMKAQMLEAIYELIDEESAHQVTKARAKKAEKRQEGLAKRAWKLRGALTSARDCLHWYYSHFPDAYQASPMAWEDLDEVLIADAKKADKEE